MCDEPNQRLKASAGCANEVGYAMDPQKSEQYRAGLRDDIEGAELHLRELRHRREGVELEIANQERYIRSLRTRLESAQ